MIAGVSERSGHHWIHHRPAGLRVQALPEHHPGVRAGQAGRHPAGGAGEGQHRAVQADGRHHRPAASLREDPAGLQSQEQSSAGGGPDVAPEHSERPRCRPADHQQAHPQHRHRLQRPPGCSEGRRLADLGGDLQVGI